MAGSRGTKVEAAFNQSLLLAGCPEEPAEESTGRKAAGKGLPVAKQDPPRTPEKRHSECIKCPDPAQGSFKCCASPSKKNPNPLLSSQHSP